MCSLCASFLMCVISKLNIYALENNILIQWMTQFAFKILDDARFLGLFVCVSLCVRQRVHIFIWFSELNAYTIHVCVFVCGDGVTIKSYTLWIPYGCNWKLNSFNNLWQWSRTQSVGRYHNAMKFCRMYNFTICIKN